MHHFGTPCAIIILHINAKAFFARIIGAQMLYGIIIHGVGILAIGINGKGAVLPLQYITFLSEACGVQCAAFFIVRMGAIALGYIEGFRGAIIGIAAAGRSGDHNITFGIDGNIFRKL